MRSAGMILVPRSVDEFVNAPSLRAPEREREYMMAINQVLWLWGVLSGLVCLTTYQMRCFPNTRTIWPLGDLISLVNHQEHHMDKPNHKISNWKEYNKALMQRDSLTIWMNERATKQCHCHCHCQTHHGRQGRGFPTAIAPSRPR